MSNNSFVNPNRRGQSSSDEDYFKKILEGSGKMVLLDKFIEKYRKDGHKMLIFS